MSFSVSSFSRERLMSLSADVTAKSHNASAAGSAGSSVSSLSSAISSLASTLLNIRNKSPVRPATAAGDDEAKRLKTGETEKDLY